MITLRYTAGSDVGRIRQGNEDAAYAGARLLAVADGMGGHVGGEVASSAAIATVASLDRECPGDLAAAAEAGGAWEVVRLPVAGSIRRTV